MFLRLSVFFFCTFECVCLYVCVVVSSRACLFVHVWVCFLCTFVKELIDVRGCL